MPRNYVKFFQHALKAGYFWAPNGGVFASSKVWVGLPFACSCLPPISMLLANCSLLHSHKSMEDIKMHVLFVDSK
jgi:hypothetical protein